MNREITSAFVETSARFLRSPPSQKLRRDFAETLVKASFSEGELRRMPYFALFLSGRASKGYPVKLCTKVAQRRRISPNGQAVKVLADNPPKSARDGRSRVYCLRHGLLRQAQDGERSRTIASGVSIFIRVYQNSLSLILPRTCRYYPTCSDYACQAVEKFGIIKGGLKAGARILRCHPFAKGGYDPVQ